MIEIIYAIDKIYKDYENELKNMLFNSNGLISIEKLLNLINENFDINIYKKINMYNVLFDKINIEKLYKIFELKFYSNNINVFNDSNEIDQIEKLFMRINKLINSILDIDSSSIALGTDHNKKYISWDININKDVNLQYYKIIINKLEEGFNKKEINLCSDKNLYFYYDSKIEECLLDIILNITKKIYIKYYDRITIRNKNKSLGITSSEFFLNAEIFKSEKKFHIELFDEKEKINILHLSDMHIKKSQENYAEEFLKNYSRKVYDVINNNKDQIISKIDIIVITGDIIRAGKSSKQMLDNYLMAYEQVQIICMYLLGNLWENRVIIIPGNHDYGMINDLKINFQDRSYNYTEITRDSKEFEKFAFFHLIFDNITMNETISKLEEINNELDNIKIPISDNKFIDFYLFNTAETANTIRSNKVSLNIPSIIKPNNNKNLFLLMHHTPLFKINYYRDIFVNDCDTDYYNYILGVSDIDYEDILEVINGKGNLYLIEERKNKYNKEIKKIINTLENNKYNENNKSNGDKVNYLNGIINRNTEIVNLLICYKYNNYNEISLNDIVRTLSYFDMSRKDQEQYNKSIKNLKILGDYIILGGHQHRQQFKIEQNEKIIEVGQAYYKGEMNYSIISCGISGEPKIYSNKELNKKNGKYI